MEEAEAPLNGEATVRLYYISHNYSDVLLPSLLNSKVVSLLVACHAFGGTDTIILIACSA